MNYKHDRSKVVAKGIELFWSKGFHNLGVDEICRETGMTKGAFYNAFQSKEQFLLATLEAYGDLIVAHLQNQLSNTKSRAFDKLVALYGGMLIAQSENGFKGCLVNNMMSELSALNLKVAKISANQFRRFIEVIEPFVRQAQQDGDFAPNINTTQLSEIIHTTFFGFLTRAKNSNIPTEKLMILFLNTLNNKRYGTN